MVYHGVSDATVSVFDTLRWCEAMNRKMGGNAQDYTRAYVVPGMGHCSGGPATDKFDMQPQLVDWVEKGIAPDQVVATATSLGCFNAAAHTGLLCPYPKQSRYNGSGDINVASNFSCRSWRASGIRARRVDVASAWAPTFVGVTVLKLREINWQMAADTGNDWHVLSVTAV